MHARSSLRGAIHLHTDLSHDGTMSLDELASFLRGRGFDFMATTDHSQDLSIDSIRQLETRSRELSSKDFLVIPGIEFTCRDTIHILGLGVTELAGVEDPRAVIEHIHHHLGVAVLAHPAIKKYPLHEPWVEHLDGCELWNGANDGKYLPVKRSVDCFRTLSERHGRLLAFAGMDLHRKSSFYPISLRLFTDTLAKENIISAMRTGQFAIESPLFRCGSHGNGALAYGIAGTLSRQALGLLRGVLRREARSLP